MKTLEVRDGGDQARPDALETTWHRVPFDYQKLLDDCSGNPAILSRLLSSFESESRVDLAALETALEVNDATLAARLAHRIRGSAAVVGAWRMHEQASLLELLGMKGELESAPECLKRLRTEFELWGEFMVSLVGERVPDREATGRVDP